MAKTTKPDERPCKDCKAEWGDSPPPRPSLWRPAPHPGPRCRTHHLAERDRRRKAAHERRVGDTYGLPPGMYDRLYEAQGRVCALCRTATGKTKRLAVDHDHSCCSGKESCGRCVRGLLCGPCNDVLAVARDSADYFLGAIAYLANPPAKAVINAAVPRVPEAGREGDDGGPVVPAQQPEDKKALRRKRNQGSEPAIPGIDEYVADFTDAYTNPGIIGNDP